MSSREKTACVEVRFAERAAQLVDEGQQENSLCASGYVYLGVLNLTCGELRLVLPVQTGGWMSADSPFVRAALCPENTAWGAYNPRLYPDTAFPALPGDTVLGTLRTGKRRGFRVPDPPGTGRSALMVHDSVRFGSEGCISTPPGAAWEAFCAAMLDLHSQGVESIPLRVVYDCPEPDPTRCPREAKNAFFETN